MCEVKKPKWMWNTIKLTGKCMTTKITAENLIMVDRISTNKLCQKMKSHIQQQASQQLCIVERRDKFVGSFFGEDFLDFLLYAVCEFFYMISKVHTHRVLSNIHVIKCFTIAILCTESSFFLYTFTFITHSKLSLKLHPVPVWWCVFMTFKQYI